MYFCSQYFSDKRNINTINNLIIMNDNLEIIQSRSVLDLLTVANEFCYFTENIKTKNRESCLSFYQKILPLLYLKGSLIPEIEVSDSSANERFVNEEQWETIYNSVKDIFQEKDIFLTLNELNEVVETSIADHISDIYQDIKDFVMLFQRNRLVAQENAVFECKNLFERHWGQRIARLLEYLHKQNYSQDEENYF
jgi:hypothetical protein